MSATRSRKASRSRKEEAEQTPARAALPAPRAEVAAGDVVREVPWVDINVEDETFQFRVAQDVGALKRSLEADGQQFPVILKGRKPPYQVVCGFRRSRALWELGVPTVKAIVRTDLTGEAAFRLAFLENEERRDLSDLDRANLVAKLEKEGKRRKEMAEILGRSERQVARYAKILDFPGEVKAAISRGGVTTGHGLALNAVLQKGHKLDVGALLGEIKEKGLSIPGLIKRLRMAVRERRKGSVQTWFQKRGAGFRIRAFAYNPRTATEADKARLVSALERALAILRGKE